ncbi:MAG: PhoH family protein [Opitutales bacterium]|jgi:phosphate starvation-inducible protein PhoH and related proteins|nr:PhoH family protein [Opitutales bacterium]MDG2170966.1 PhoH family protein [Opitutales bacterium]
MTSIEKKLKFQTPRVASQLYCGKPELLKEVEKQLSVDIVARENWIQITGPEASVKQSETFFDFLDQARAQGMDIRKSDFDAVLQQVINGRTKALETLIKDPLVLKFPKRKIIPKTLNQKRYLEAIFKKEVVFGIGPAGTGKTYLAMAAAINALLKGEIEKIILTRPAVEAGEALGFLPGDLEEKITPYLRPLYDAIHDMLGKENAEKLMEKGVIEIAPLAYMRGRTLSKAYVILDEAQNTSPEQMMMFLTRLGDNSRMIVTGDITQIDLPRKQESGLRQITQILMHIPEIELFYFESFDVVRHPLVQKIIEAYEHYRSEGHPR